jgi:hypothetical protein
MVIWTGWGIVAGIIWVACFLATQLAVDQIYEDGFYKAHVWPKILAATVSAPIIWFVGRAMNGAATDDQRAHGARHTLFWIPVEYWGPLFFIVGVVVALIDHYKGG